MRGFGGGCDAPKYTGTLLAESAGKFIFLVDKAFYRTFRAREDSMLVSAPLLARIV
jgi:hypothetical protein